MKKENDKNTVIALREIAEVSLPINEMKESLIAEYQTISFLEEEEIENTESSDDDFKASGDSLPEKDKNVSGDSLPEKDENVSGDSLSEKDENVSGDSLSEKR